MESREYSSDTTQTHPRQRHLRVQAYRNTQCKYSQSHTADLVLKASRTLDCFDSSCVGGFGKVMFFDGLWDMLTGLEGYLGRFFGRYWGRVSS